MQPTSIRPARNSDAERLAAIYNQGIVDRSSTFETAPRDAASMLERLRDVARHPLLVSCDANDHAIGWAGLSGYRPRACYAGIAEFSIYMDRHARGQGRGAPLLDALIDAARQRGYSKLVSRVFVFNQASRALCRRCGFREVGVYEKHGQLDGRWLDVVIVERLIAENLTNRELPATPASS
jgi:L-amino acid N-acyltransferase YncA